MALGISVEVVTVGADVVGKGVGEVNVVGGRGVKVRVGELLGVESKLERGEMLSTPPRFKPIPF